ncbi:MAG TPA: hypothetical protein VER03_11220 [Bryobacteraceae bacterium]|nr:hypothetical protein [Bryobacteraceae bacterium]
MLTATKPDYRTGVSLHGHTVYSRESLRFLDVLARRSWMLRSLLERGRRQFRNKFRTDLVLERGWWTPPLGEHQALLLEREQLEGLGLESIVSLTDHDNSTAGLVLRGVGFSAEKVPVSLEWSLPYRSSELHLGIHNIPADIAVDLTRLLNEYTRRPCASGPAAILEHIAAYEGSLVVLNHPLWDETHVGGDIHLQAVRDLLTTCGAFIHALEWNGLRSRRENLRVVGLAEAWSKSIVSGGDRHTSEPNTCINLTDASSFSEFAEEVRSGHSTVMILPAYWEPATLRVTRMVIDVLAEHPEHPRGWMRWSDRVFYAAKGVSPRSLTSLFQDGSTATLGLLDRATMYLPASALSDMARLTTVGRQPVYL